LPKGAKELQVLGQPRLVAGPEGVIELSWPELELLARLALEPGRVFSSEELRADMGAAKETDWAPTTLWTRASSLRRAVGAEHVPSSSKAGGYKVVGIGTDVARFESAMARAKAHPSEAAAHLAEALSLLRGAPFASVPAGTFNWAHDAGGLATRLSNAAFDAAIELAQTAIAGKEAVMASWAIGKGRLIASDDELWDELALDAAAASPERSALARAWADMKTRYRAKGKDVPRPLLSRYHELRGGAKS
jgi:DNA-binding SARP family transcriptional activator